MSLAVAAVLSAAALALAPQAAPPASAVAAPAATAPTTAPATAAPAEPAAQLPPTERLTWVVHAYPAWSPDDRHVAFQTSLAGQFDVWVMEVATRKAWPVAASPAHDITPLWSPDGKRLAFVSEREGNRDVFTCAADGSAAVNLTRHPSQDLHPAWSADGTRILFSSNRDTSGPDDYDAWSMRSDGTELKRLTSGPEIDTYASWSPDGRSILLRRVLDGGDNEVFLLDADGGNPRNLTKDPASYDGWPVWSPDGRHVAYSSGPAGRSPHRLWLLELATGRRTMLTDEDPIFRHVYDTQPHFSSDGRRLIFTRYRPGPREATELVIVDLAAIVAAPAAPDPAPPSGRG